MASSTGTPRRTTAAPPRSAPPGLGPADKSETGVESDPESALRRRSVAMGQHLVGVVEVAEYLGLVSRGRRPVLIRGGRRDQQRQLLRAETLVEGLRGDRTCGSGSRRCARSSDEGVGARRYLILMSTAARTGPGRPRLDTQSMPGEARDGTVRVGSGSARVASSNSRNRGPRQGSSAP